MKRNEKEARSECRWENTSDSRWSNLHFFSSSKSYRTCLLYSLIISSCLFRSTSVVLLVPCRSIIFLRSRTRSLEFFSFVGLILVKRRERISGEMNREGHHRWDNRTDDGEILARSLATDLTIIRRMDNMQREWVTLLELNWPTRLWRWIQLRREHECVLFNVKSWSNRDFSLAWISDARAMNDVCLGLRHWTSITREEILPKWLSFDRSLRFPPRNLSRTDEWQIDSSKWALLISSRCSPSPSLSLDMCSRHLTYPEILERRACSSWEEDRIVVMNDKKEERSSMFFSLFICHRFDTFDRVLSIYSL